MFRFIKNLIARARLHKIQRECSHELTPNVKISGEWGKPEPHPHPHFAGKIKVIRRPFCNVRVCFKCGSVYPVFGYDQGAADPASEADDPKKMSDPAFSPKRIFPDEYRPKQNA